MLTLFWFLDDGVEKVNGVVEVVDEVQSIPFQITFTFAVDGVFMRCETFELEVVVVLRLGNTTASALTVEMVDWYADVLVLEV